MAMEDKETASKRGNNSASFREDGINGKTFEKWTEERVHEMLDKLEDWMRPKIVYVTIGKGRNKQETDEIDYISFNPNKVFFKDFLLAHKLYASWLQYVGDKYESVSKRIKDIKEMQEQLIVRASAMGDIKERTAQFILMQWYDWRAKTDNTHTDLQPVVFEITKTYDKKK